MRSFSFATRALALVVTAIVTIALRESDAVTISPTAIYLSSRDRSASFELYNGDDFPSEVELSLAFGYPMSDSLGRVDVKLSDTAASNEPSAVPWLRLYPRRVVLQPKQHQLVRVGAYPPAIPTGEYWARLLVRSRPAATPVDQRDAVRRPEMRIETLFITAVNYRNGAVATGIRVDTAIASATDSSARLLLDLRRVGNAAFLGHLAAELRSPDGRVVSRTDEDIAVYRTLRKIVELPLPSRAQRAGLTLQYRLTTDRDDLGPRAVHAEPVAGQVSLLR